MLVAINYADKNFKDSQILNTKTAYKKGKVDKVIEYSPDDIDEDFIKQYDHILCNKRGGGYWLWKPYFISKTMDELKDGDYLFYCDSGAYYINNVKYLVDALEKSNQDVMVFELPLIEEEWTKVETFDILGCNEEKYRVSNQRLATYILLKVGKYSKIFIKEYLNYCTDSKCLTDESLDRIKNVNLKNHRHDQSILSLLSKKNNIIPFRDPSQYGVRPWEYISGDRQYNILEYKNSDYPQIVVSHRKANINEFRVKEFIKRQLTRIGILSKFNKIDKL